MVYRVQSQRTYHGKTGGGLVASAIVAQSNAGTWQVWIDGAIAELSDYDELILTDTSGVLAAVTLSPTALRRMRSLIAQCERSYTAGVSAAARALGHKGGKANTPAQNAARAENGGKGAPESHLRGGRPKKIAEQPHGDFENMEAAEIE